MMLTIPDHIQLYQLTQLKAMVQLEALGMTRRGRSATVIAKEFLGLKRSTRREVVLDKLVDRIQADMLALSIKKSQVVDN
jgi:stress-induced morphogen